MDILKDSTTRPWRYEETNKTEEPYSYYLYGDKTGAIGFTKNGFVGYKKVDAELIVRAVNSHETLVETLENLVLEAVHVWEYSEDYVDIAEAIKALSLAKGEQP